MRNLLGAVLLLIAACGATAVESSTTSATLVSTTSQAPTTVPRPEEIPVVIQGCTTPQVGFSPLCETYGLAQEWHMDRPIEPGVLAGAALSGLEAFTTDNTAPVPRTLFCDIPDPAFTPLCDEMARRMLYEGIPVDDAIEAAVLAMGDTGLGPFSYYIPPEAVGSYRTNGVVGGVGLLLDATDAVGSKCVRITDACPLQIVFVLEDNPGAEAGLQPGDRITMIDGESVDALGFVDTATRIAGDETGVVEISVERGEQVITFSVERAPLVVPTVEIDIPRPGIGYMRIPDFEPDIPDLVHEGLLSLNDSDIDRLVVDLRDNPGGFIDASIDVASEFMTGGVVVQTVGPGENFEYNAGQGGLATDLDIAVMVNAGTASAAEILAAALRDRRQAPIIGEPTYGKNAVQIAFELNNGGEFNVAVARWLSPEGTSVADTGILPDRPGSLPPSMEPGELADLAFQGQ